jgi:hypothetical protein
LGFLCFGCPAILTSFPDGVYHVREIWSGREYNTTLGNETPLMTAEPSGSDAMASDPLPQS